MRVNIEQNVIYIVLYSSVADFLDTLYMIFGIILQLKQKLQKIFGSDFWDRWC